jgi:hypothetical protein
VRLPYYPECLIPKATVATPFGPVKARAEPAPAPADHWLGTPNCGRRSKLLKPGRRAIARPSGPTPGPGQVGTAEAREGPEAEVAYGRGPANGGILEGWTRRGRRWGPVSTRLTWPAGQAQARGWARRETMRLALRRSHRGPGVVFDGGANAWRHPFPEHPCARQAAPIRVQFRQPPPAHGRSTRGGTGLFFRAERLHRSSGGLLGRDLHEPNRRLRHCDVVSERVAYRGATPSRRIDLVEVGLEVH